MLDDSDHPDQRREDEFPDYPGQLPRQVANALCKPLQRVGGMEDVARHDHPHSAVASVPEFAYAASPPELRQPSHEP